jgi:large subunit ribosomal protein L3
MVSGLVGKKIGMTRIFTEKGESIAVSVIQVIPNRITQIKNIETDGYSAIQVTTGHKKVSRLNKALIGHFAKSNVEPGDGLWEFRLDKTDSFKTGDALTVQLFENINYVDVIAVSKGKGFSGVIKRHNFSSQDATHGNSLSHNVPGSIGQRQSPGKVFKGKKMAGQLGNKQKTVQNLRLIKVDIEKNLLLICGGVPGSSNTHVVIYPAKKLKREVKSDAS